MDADLRMRLEAHINNTEGPSIWTPEHVQRRYIEALKVVGKLPIAILGGSGSAWPSLLVDMAKAVDCEARRTLAGHALDNLGIARNDEVAVSNRFASDGPSAEQISRAEEAIAWPMIYLADLPKGADAFSLYCYAKAFKSFEILPFLRERLRQAREMAKREAHEINARHPDHAWARQKRSQIAREVAEMVNGWLANADGEAHAAILREQAIEIMRERCEETGCAMVPPRPAHLLAPGYVLERSVLDKYRKRAATTIAKALRADRIPFR